MIDIVVTGGSKGIGRAIAQHALTLEDRVAIVCRSEPDFRAPNLIWVEADLENVDAAICALDRAISHHGLSPKVVVSAAVDYGGTGRAAARTLTSSVAKRVMMVNALAPTILVSHLLRQWDLRTVVSITSDVAFGSCAGRVAYGMSKAAAQTFFDGLAEEHGAGGPTVVSMMPRQQVDTPGLRARRPTNFDFSEYQTSHSLGIAYSNLLDLSHEQAHGRVFVVAPDGLLTEFSRSGSTESDGKR